MKIKYYAGIHVPAGWRQVEYISTVEKISPKMVKVIHVDLIDGEEPSKKQSRTGANRQKFNGEWWAAHEVGKNKRLSSCTILEE